MTMESGAEVKVAQGGVQRGGGGLTSTGQGQTSKADFDTLPLAGPVNVRAV